MSTAPVDQPRHAAAWPGRSVPRRQFVALFTAVMLPMFLAAVDQTLLATATPHIAADLGQLGDTPWIAVGYLLAATVMAPVYGRLGDQLGRRRVLMAALGVFAVGSLACGWAGSMSMLVAARVVQGLGGGGLMVMSQALIGEVVEPRERPRYQLYFAAVFTTASVGGPVVGGLVVSHASWRWLFLVNLPLCLLAAWRVARMPPAPADAEPAGSAARSTPLDPLGVMLFAATACSALLWLSFVGHRFALRSPASAALLGAALSGGATLWWQQRRRAAPFLPLDVLGEPGVAWICSSVLCFAATLFALVFLVPIYLQAGHGVSAAGAGLQLLPLTGGLVAGSTLNARLSARLASSGHLPPFGLAVAAAALLTLALAPPGQGVLIAAVALCGVGLGSVMPSAQLATQVLAGRRRLGAAAALISLTRSLGAALGTAAFGGLVFALLHTDTPAAQQHGVSLQNLAPQQIRHAFHVAFGLLAAVAALGAAAALRAPRVALQQEPLQAGGIDATAVST